MKKQQPGGGLMNRFSKPSISKLIKEINQNNYDNVKKIIDSGVVNLNSVDKKGNFPIQYTLNPEQYEIAKLLLINGANPNVYTPSSETPLHIASRNKYTPMVQLLLTHNADINAKDDSGRTALMICSSNGYTENVQLLLNNNADIHALNDEGLSALHFAVLSNNYDTVSLLLTHHANPNLQSKNLLQTPLYFATRNGFVDILKILIQYGADPNIRDKNGNNVLSVALSQTNKNIEIIKLLLEKTKDLHEDKLKILISTSVKHGDTDIIKQLAQRAPSIKEMLDSEGDKLIPIVMQIINTKMHTTQNKDTLEKYQQLKHILHMNELPQPVNNNKNMPFIFFISLPPIILKDIRQITSQETNILIDFIIQKIYSIGLDKVKELIRNDKLVTFRDSHYHSDYPLFNIVYNNSIDEFIIVIPKGTLLFRGDKENYSISSFNDRMFYTYPVPFAALGVKGMRVDYRYFRVFQTLQDIQMIVGALPVCRTRIDMEGNEVTRLRKGRISCGYEDQFFFKSIIQSQSISGTDTIVEMDSLVSSVGGSMRYAFDRTYKVLGNNNANVLKYYIQKLQINKMGTVGFPEIVLYYTSGIENVIKDVFTVKDTSNRRKQYIIQTKKWLDTQNNDGKLYYDTRTGYFVLRDNKLNNKDIYCESIPISAKDVLTKIDIDNQNFETPITDYVGKYPELTDKLFNSIQNKDFRSSYQAVRKIVGNVKCIDTETPIDIPNRNNKRKPVSNKNNNWRGGYNQTQSLLSKEDYYKGYAQYLLPPPEFFNKAKNNTMISNNVNWRGGAITK